MSDPTCGGANFELARYITPFRRGLGRWLTDVTPLLPLLFGDQAAGAPATCAFTAATDAWSMPWFPSLSLRLDRAPAPARAPARALTSLWQTGAGGNGGIAWGVAFDARYNDGENFPPRAVDVPRGATRATLHAVFTGHGSDNNNCAEFCVTTHAVTIGATTFAETFEAAGTDEGCTNATAAGALPNEHGTWLYGRDGWCDGSAVRPWVVDVTGAVDWAAGRVNVSYRGTFRGADPAPPPQENMPYIIVHAYISWA